MRKTAESMESATDDKERELRYSKELMSAVPDGSAKPREETTSEVLIGRGRWGRRDRWESTRQDESDATNTGWGREEKCRSEDDARCDLMCTMVLTP